VKRSAAFLLVLAATAFVSSTPAQASHVRCGDVIARDTRLDSDLIDCPGNGIVIGADGITLDLGGHVIDGVQFQSPVGVDDTGHDGVTIRNGSVQQFATGIALRNTNDSRVTNVRVREAFWGLALQHAHRNHLAGNEVSESTTAIDLADDAEGNVITHNALTRNANGIFLATHESDDRMRQPPSHNLVVRNVISQNQYGIWAWFCVFNTFEGNSMDANSEYGVLISFTSSGNSVNGNHLTANQEGIAVRGQVAATRVFRNRIADSVEDGIVVDSVPSSPQSPNLVERNVSNGNGDDGIDLDRPGAVVTKNTANFNSEFGIESVPGVTDGGGNKARGNGNPAQCLNVSCK
jgi:parallel beta-helix repeat protein